MVSGPSTGWLLNIPEDVRIHILLALDIVSLLRCKRVSIVHIIHGIDR